MKITNDKVGFIHYKLTIDENVVDSSEGKDPLVYIHGKGNLIPGLESELENKTAGDRLQATIAPADAYGQRNQELVQSVPLSNFDNKDAIEIGAQFQVDTPEGARLASIIAVAETEATIDLNHPLAGMTLTFDVEIMEVRDATEDELVHGHVHGSCGHEH
jgi:FKBP-type peptidyl-prolyl cis-trans isomerase SlyD